MCMRSVVAANDNAFPSAVLLHIYWLLGGWGSKEGVGGEGERGYNCCTFTSLLVTEKKRVEWGVGVGVSRNLEVMERKCCFCLYI
jgi:hypothetical protein